MACSIMGFRTKQTPPPARRRAAKNKREEQPQRTAYTYRRNRTLTGSLVSRVPSAGEPKALLRSPRMHGTVAWSGSGAAGCSVVCAR